jgi:TPP-dependent pyruvate/acetoin dehydrogenase alpha subunit
MGDDRQLDWYAAMYRIRRVEETLLDLVRQREIAGSVHLCIGQEAIPVGACAAISPDDPVISTYRGHGWALARGVPLVELLAEALGRDSALNGGRGGSAYLSGPQYGFFGENSIVGAGVPMAMGLALSATFQGGDRVPVVSIGDGAVNQGVVHEALNMASVLRAGVMVLVEDNGYAEMTPSDALTAVRAAARAPAYGIEALEADGNDPSAVALAVTKARALARSDRRPVLVEAHTRRLGGHYSGDAQHYRPVGELEAWRAGDPLTRAAESIGRPDHLETVRGGVDREVENALAEARARPLPDPSTATDFVYTEG